jgi:hypothetical protein
VQHSNSSPNAQQYKYPYAYICLLLQPNKFDKNDIKNNINRSVASRYHVTTTDHSEQPYWKMAIRIVDAKRIDLKFEVVVEQTFLQILTLNWR